MTRKRTILFLGILLALLLVPTVLPYLIGHLLLPFWAYLLYAFILLVNAGIYLANRLRRITMTQAMILPAVFAIVKVFIQSTNITNRGGNAKRAA